MKKLNLKEFEVNTVKSEISTNITGGYGEGTGTDTCSGTNGQWYHAGDWYNYPDSSTDGDYYTSC